MTAGRPGSPGRRGSLVCYWKTTAAEPDSPDYCSPPAEELDNLDHYPSEAPDNRDSRSAGQVD